MKEVIARLYRYRDALFRLKNLGFQKVFSDNLSDVVGVTASQVRKDLLMFGSMGNKRAGYEIEDLLDKLNEAMGKDKVQKVIVIGAGNIGTALVNHKGFEADGIKILAVFDKDFRKVNRKAMVPVYPIDELKEFTRSNEVRVAVVAVPDAAAREVFEILLDSEVKGILNFTNVRMSVPDERIYVSHVDLALELESVIYRVNSSGKKPAAASKRKTK